MVDRIFVPMNSKPHDHRHRLVAKIAVVTEGLARVGVADVQLNEWDGDASEGIADGDARVGEAGGVDDDHIHLAAGSMQPVDDGTLVIRLECLQRCAETLCLGLGVGLYFGKGGVPVDVRFPEPQQVEIGAVDE